MQTSLPYLIAIVFLFVSGLVRAIARPGVHVSWEDFNFGPEAALAALLLGLDPAGDVGSILKNKPAGTGQLVGITGLLAGLTAIIITRYLYQRASAQQPRGFAFWLPWIVSNLLGATCVGLAVWAKLPA